MGDGLGVCGDAVVLGGGEVDMFGFEAGEDVLDFVKVFLGGTMLNDYLDEIVSLALVRIIRTAHQWLAARINIGTVERVAADDVDIFWKRLLESSYLRSFA